MEQRKLSDTGRLSYIDWVFIGGIALIVIGYVFMHDILGGTLLAHYELDSYTLQAQAWLDGKMSLGQGYSYLELAEYAGDWYVSFPPFPSVVLLPLVLIFGGDTPNNFVMMMIVLLAVTFAYLCFKKLGASSTAAMFWAVFAVLGSNMLWMSTMGGAWFLAQGLNLLLCFASVFCYLTKKRALCLALVALAVGCRPFSVIFFAALFAFMCMDDYGEEKPLLRCIAKNLKYLIIPAAIAAVYLWYNYARFGDPLEFGHNYLPEFSAEGSEQFGLSYVPENLYRLLLRPVTLAADGRLEFSTFDGFMFFVANPIFLSWFIYIAIDVVKKRFTVKKAVLCAGLAATMLSLMAHKTLGGWQFGARYTVDMIPFVLVYLLLCRAVKPSRVDVLLGCFAVMFNLYGTFYMYFVYV